MTTTPAIAPALPAPAVTAAPVAVLPPEPQTPEPQIPKVRKFTVAEYYRMAEVGILSPEERVQLIEGEIIVMPPMGPGHAGKIIRSNRLFWRLAADQFLVCIQNPLHLDDGSEPEPDVMLVRPRADCYETIHPTPADTFVVLEVSDSTLEYDRNRKAQVYGRAGVAQTPGAGAVRATQHLWAGRRGANPGAEPAGGLHRKFYRAGAAGLRPPYHPPAGRQNKAGRPARCGIGGRGFAAAGAGGGGGYGNG